MVNSVNESDERVLVIQEQMDHDCVTHVAGSWYDWWELPALTSVEYGLIMLERVQDEHRAFGRTPLPLRLIERRTVQRVTIEVLS